MGNFLFCNCPGSNSSLNTDCEQLWGNCFFHLFANLFSKFISSLFVNQKGQCIDWIIHYMNDHFDNFSLPEPMHFIIEWPVSMCHRFEFIHKINNNFRQRKLAFDNDFSVFNDIFIHICASFIFNQRFNGFIVISRSNNCCLDNRFLKIIWTIFIRSIKGRFNINFLNKPLFTSPFLSLQ